MSYIHEVSLEWSEENMVGLRHFRETITPSGVIFVTELARTLPTFRPSAETERQSGLVLPSSDITMLANLERTEENAPIIVSCQRREEIVSTGLSAWKYFLSQAGVIHDVQLCLAENHGALEKPTDGQNRDKSTNDAPEIRFVGYDAFPDEIESLEALAAAIKRQIHKSPNPLPGLYL